MKGIMFQGTSSDVGKSVLTTAVCRILKNKGYDVVPFKSQNMSNNSYVTIDGKEIGRAQGIQAEACGVEANVYMNPLLLKPKSDRSSEVVRLGVAEKSISGSNYRKEYYEIGVETIQQSLKELEKQAEVIVIEGAGSPAEVNLNDREIVNMKVAELADVPVILIADIERGGIFASIIGTLLLLDEKHRKRVKGIIVNKFRGDPQLFESGIRFIEEKTNVPVLGVIPYLPINIDSEDSLALRKWTNKKQEFSENMVNIGVIQPTYISNLTDIEPFFLEEDVSVHFINNPNELFLLDAVIIPGTKSTIQDLTELKKKMFPQALHTFVERGGFVCGICGGYQMLGETLVDESGVDTGEKGTVVKGFGLLPLETKFFNTKTTKRFQGTMRWDKETFCQVDGYEIHLGQSFPIKKVEPFAINHEKEEGMLAKEKHVIGTYIHHIFFNDEFRHLWLNEIRFQKGLPLKEKINRSDEKEKNYEYLAKEVSAHLDVEKMIEIMENWKKDE
ncbi:MAG TPA: cobyric acid synthase [Massilibacterium sp.]|nr:cobyric acid synthase [Massilibacterium sp.]